MIKLSKKDFNKALIGLALGDGHLSGNRLIITHSDKQKYYTDWLIRFFHNHGYKTKLRKNLVRGIYTTYTLTVQDIYRKGFIHAKGTRMFNSSGKKIVTSYLMKQISTLGLLLWFLDDGSLSVSEKTNSKYGNTSRFAKFSTESFSFNEHKTIAKYMKSRFDIECKIYKSKISKATGEQLYHTYLPASEFRKFYDLVSEFFPEIPPEFDYKFNMKYKINALNPASRLSYNGFHSPNSGEAPRLDVAIEQDIVQPSSNTG